METIVSLETLILHLQDTSLGESLKEDGKAKTIKFNTVLVDTKFIILINALNLNVLDPYF